jgi:hypothetical protein
MQVLEWISKLSREPSRSRTTCRPAIPNTQNTKKQEKSDRATAQAPTAERELRDARGDWLAQREWEFFVTLTFRDVIGPNQANRKVRRWIRLLEQRSQQRVGWLTVISPVQAATFTCTP